MNDIILVKLGELVLKGLNRRRFEQKLQSNIRRRLEKIGEFKVYCLQSTIYVEGKDDSADMDAAMEILQKIFGIVSIVRAAACEKDKDAIVALAKEYLREDMLNAKSFKVESKRSDKAFPMTSIQLSQYVGGELAEAFPDLSEHLLNIERNIKDLLVPFQSGYYYNKAMGGSFSIKSVLPAIFPDDPALDYHNLEQIHNGGEAMSIFPKIKDMPKEEQKTTRKNLLKYCELDTYAMVKIWEELKRVVE